MNVFEFVHILQSVDGEMRMFVLNYMHTDLNKRYEVSPGYEDSFPSLQSRKVSGKSILNNWFIVNERPSSYGCTREVAKHETSAKVARGDSRVRL